MFYFFLLLTFFLFLVFIVFRLIYNINSKLYLISNDTIIDDQNLILVSRLHKSKFKTDEDIELTLSDFEGNKHIYYIGFSKWLGYFFKNIQQDNKVKNKKIKNGSKLNLNGREFTFIYSHKLIFKKEDSLKPYSKELL